MQKQNKAKFIVFFLAAQMWVWLVLFFFCLCLLRSDTHSLVSVESCLCTINPWSTANKSEALCLLADWSSRMYTHVPTRTHKRRIVGGWGHGGQIEWINTLQITAYSSNHLYAVISDQGCCRDQRYYQKTIGTCYWSALDWCPLLGRTEHLRAYDVQANVARLHQQTLPTFYLCPAMRRRITGALRL